jgi:D-xylose transport system ATP-binding protein
MTANGFDAKHPAGEARIVTQDAAATGAPLLEVRALAKSYGAVTALRNANLRLEAGEVVALAGDNGAGKSTFIKILSGIVAPDTGEIRFMGNPVSFREPGDASRLGIQTVYQDLALCGNLNVVDNLFLGGERRTAWWLGYRLERPSMERRAREVLNSVGIRIERLDSLVASLSGGQRQCIAVSRAILGDPKIVILDEPTAALGVTQTHEVLELIRRLREQGRAVILISHDLPDVLTVADRIIVMRLGQTVADRPVSEWTEHSLVSAITGAASLAGPN